MMGAPYVWDVKNIFFKKFGQHAGVISHLHAKVLFVKKKAFEVERVFQNQSPTVPNTLWHVVTTQKVSKK